MALNDWIVTVPSVLSRGYGIPRYNYIHLT